MTTILSNSYLLQLELISVFKSTCLQRTQVATWADRILWNHFGSFRHAIGKKSYPAEIFSVIIAEYFHRGLRFVR